MVVKFKYSEGCQITSIDNRRLHSAQVANISELLVDCHDSTDIIDDKISRKRFQCLIAFCDGDKSCFTIVLYPKVYGAIVMSRCALQTSEFLLHGTYGTPYIGRRPKSTHYWDDDFDADCEAVKKTEFSKVIAQMKSATEIIMYLDDGCPCVCNDKMGILLRECLLDYFDVWMIFHWTNYCFFKAGEGLRKDNEDDQNRQEEIDKLLAERESELLRARDDAYHEYRVPRNVEYGITL